jgi:hypothetical protein
MRAAIRRVAAGIARAPRHRMQHDHPFTSVDLELVTGGGLRGAAYAAIVATTIAAGTPSGQRHDDPSRGPLHAVSPTGTSQAR